MIARIVYNNRRYRFVKRGGHWFGYRYHIHGPSHFGRMDFNPAVSACIVAPGFWFATSRLGYWPSGA